MKKKNIGSTFDSFLREEGIYKEVSASAIKRVVARQVEAAMEERGLSKTEMAKRMSCGARSTPGPRERCYHSQHIAEGGRRRWLASAA
jgi:hypothetical protein